MLFSYPESSDSENEDNSIMRGHDLIADHKSSNYKKSKKLLPLMFPYYDGKSKRDPYGVLIKYNIFLHEKYNFIFIFIFFLDKKSLLNLILIKMII